MTIRVLIADDQNLVRSGLCMILATQPDIEVVAEAQDGREAVELVGILRPDIVLMDIRMPGTDGLAATKAVAGDPATAATRVVMLTTYDLDEYLFEALQAGAAGFLLKGVSPEDLIRGVREVAAGDCLLAPSATRRLITEFVNSRPTGPADTSARHLVGTLTPRELEVLALMAQGLSNSEIADELIVGENTIKTHVSHVLNKLASRDRIQAVILAYQAGLTEPKTSH
ncbi:MAG TPA: response regulator transcription factor [Acidimicrobiales bacterium]|nr:response regulator transcription factor [Acidimicrobiales bacterium]